MKNSGESIAVKRRRLRYELGLSRSEFGRFLGVSEATVVRWESGQGVSEPKGLQALLLSALRDAVEHHPTREIASLVRSCGLDHRSALRMLLEAAR
jgi:DNA-binding transcriptional regulator YiaG